MTISLGRIFMSPPGPLAESADTRSAGSRHLSHVQDRSGRGRVETELSRDLDILVVIGASSSTKSAALAFISKDAGWSRIQVCHHSRRG